jgi:hypothetical protein
MITTLKQPSIVKARKQHICDLCGYRIVSGEKYIASTHVHDNIYVFRSHKYCHKLMLDLDMYKNSEYEGVTMDFFQEEVSEQYYTILTNMVDESDRKKYKDILGQLVKVNFRDKLWYLIRYYNKK